MRPRLAPLNMVKRIADLIAAAVIPLFYANKNHTLYFKGFLRRHPDKMRYLEICQKLQNLLIVINDKRKEELLLQLSQIKKDIRSTVECQVEHEKFIKNITGRGPLFPRKIHQNRKSIIKNQKLESRNFIDGQISYHQEQLQKLEDEKLKLIRLIDTPINEIDAFDKELDLYCINPGDGYRYLIVYLQSHSELIDFFYDNSELIINVSENWIDYVMERKQLHPMQLLPSYFCAFDAKDPHYRYTVGYRTQKSSDKGASKELWEKSASHFECHVKTAEKNELWYLTFRMLYIQVKYFGNIYQTQARNDGHVSLVLQHTTLFQVPADHPETNSDHSKECPQAHSS